jgi:glycosyltransferase involved in cell wall biosynthesis
MPNLGRRGRSLYKDIYFDKVADSGDVNRFVFWSARHDVYAIMKQMDILLMPSRYEPFGLVAVEAFLLGKPVVGYKVGGLAELLEDFPLGFGIPSGNKEAMIQQTIQLLEQPHTMNKNVNNPFEASIISRQWCKYYQDIHEQKYTNDERILFSK